MILWYSIFLPAAKVQRMNFAGTQKKNDTLNVHFGCKTLLQFHRQSPYLIDHIKPLDKGTIFIDAIKCSSAQRLSYIKVFIL